MGEEEEWEGGCRMGRELFLCKLNLNCGVRYASTVAPYSRPSILHLPPSTLVRRTRPRPPLLPPPLRPSVAVSRVLVADLVWTARPAGKGGRKQAGCGRTLHTSLTRRGVYSLLVPWRTLQVSGCCKDFPSLGWEILVGSASSSSTKHEERLGQCRWEFLPETSYG
eukprot:2119166-Rhodomonas_salina.2